MEKKQRKVNGDTITIVCILTGIIVVAIITGINFYPYVDDSMYLLILLIVGVGVGGGGFAGTLVGEYSSRIFLRTLINCN